MIIIVYRNIKKIVIIVKMFEYKYFIYSMYFYKMNEILLSVFV